MGHHFRHSSCRYFIICIWIGNFISAQTITQDSNSGSSQGHHLGSSYFFYQRPEFPRDCEEVQQQCSFQNKSGVYVIKPDGLPAPFEVVCDNTDEGGQGGWTVILRRVDGSVGTKRTWDEYKDGFGFLGSEFWLGNNKIAYLTNQKRYELRIDMVTSDGSSFHISYDKFRISDEWSGFSLTSLGVYSGTADSFTTCGRNMEFGACSCQGTCDQPEVQNRCNNDCVNGEGCFCPDGFLFQGSDCVPASECGCFVQGRGVLSQNGDVYVNADCSNRCTCSNNILTCENYGCGLNANCEERNGVRKCYCADGFEGNGLICTSTVRKDCLDLYNAGDRNNGVYTINPPGGRSFQVYCDMTTGDGGWTVFQRRKDGGTSFYRNWSSYKRGFGALTDEFWIGNDKLHTITNQKSYQLRIDMRDSAGSRYYALYTLFRVSNEGDNYRLAGLGTFSGTAGYDSMNTRRNRPFSTYDNDNELSSYNCAEKHRGGWWYGYDDGHYYYYYSYCYYWQVGSRYYYCSVSNLNGDYQGGNGQNIFWYDLPGNDCNIKFTEMKIRPV
ncbi:Fibrinogen-like protein A [Holothuria leucospilota]|uniref:Fibrinogen-like protein A n=1 Tax=Holothuria leucospilota TaxID=206669 RepID=A0A9Q1BUR9_HOLLE|nr:Fibrinogen-like protein A [Holothuria leucospilota]